MSAPDGIALVAGGIAAVAQASTLVLGLGLLILRAQSAAPAAARHGLGLCIFAALAATPAVVLAQGANLASGASLLVGLWAAGALVALAPTLLGLRRLTDLARSPQARLLEKRGRVRIIEAPVATPLTWGGWRPTIALPLGLAATCTPAELTAILAHEQAHIDRGDWAAQTAVTLLCGLFWFQPLAWIARSKLLADAEHAADDAVLKAGVRPSAYATLLLRLSRPSAGVAPAISGSPIAARIAAVLAPAGPRRQGPWPSRFAGALLFAFALPALHWAPVWVPLPQAPSCNPKPDPISEPGLLP